MLIHEVFFYAGLLLIGIALVGLVAVMIIFRLYKRQLEESLEREYGKLQ